MAEDRIKTTGMEIDFSELNLFSKLFPLKVVDRTIQFVATDVGGNMIREAPVDEGRLQGNIGDAIKIKDLSWGIPIDVNYWEAVVFGRKAIIPVSAKALRFEINGQVIFAKFVKATEPNDFIGRAVDKTEPKISTFVERAIQLTEKEIN